MRARELLSGAHWCERFWGDRTTATLVQPFRKNVQRFITALEAGGAHVSISATWRPLQRAYLMRGAWDVAHRKVPPEDVPPMEGVPIRWVHPERARSFDAAEEMVQAYRLAVRPSLMSLHIQGRAIDMNINWGRTIIVIDGHGQRVGLSTDKGTDMNPDLWAVGRSYGVYKLESDPPHWSDTGG